MRRFAMQSTIVACSLLLSLSASFAASGSPRDFEPVQNGYASSSAPVLPYAPDRVLVKLTTTALERAELDVALRRGAAGRAVRTGLESVDRKSAELGVSGIVRTFGSVRNRVESERLGIDRWFSFELDGTTDVPTAVARLAADADVETAAPDWRAFPALTPNDPLFANHWGHDNTGQLPDFDWGGSWDHTGSPIGTPGFDADAETGWNGSQAYGSAGVVIAILDSGVDVGHPDLLQVAGWDYGDGDSNPDDNSGNPGHGTACAGVAAAIADNGTGIAGAAGGCSIMPLKTADSGGTMYFSYIDNALYHAADNGADVVSMSFGAAISSNPSTDAALQYCDNAGVTLLAATGNENDNAISYPAISPYVIGVGAASPCGDRKRSSSSSGEVNPGVYTDPNGYTCDGERWWGSNYGVNTQDAAGAVDLIAPTILPTTDIQGGGGYASGDYSMFFNGTSCATPYAAGVCGLIKSANPGWTPTQIRNQLLSTATDVVNVESGSGWDRYSGYGMINAGDAVGTIPPPPVASFSGTPTSGCAPLLVSFTDLSTGSVTSWSWTFGDGDTSTSQNPSHAYAAGGTYDVALNVTGPGGSDTATVLGYVDVTAPVVADFSGTPLTGTAPLSVDFTDLSSAAPTSWSWDFGDAATDSVQNPSHTYTSAGTYTVALTADNGCGPDALTKTAYVTVNPPPAPVADFSGTPTSGCTPLLVDFTDASSGDITNWDWDFGDGGTSTAQNPSHAFTSAADHDVSLTVTGPGGSDVKSQAGYVTATDAVAADFSATPLLGDEPLAVDFTDLSTGAPAAWVWDFGDGGVDSVPNPSHTYTTGGTYSVTLIVANACNSDSLVRIDYVTVNQVTSAIVNMPKEFALRQNFPNPFDSGTTILFSLGEAGPAKLEIFDVAGRRVATLVDGEYGAGGHRIVWDAGRQPAGIHFAKFSANGKEAIIRMMHVR